LKLSVVTPVFNEREALPHLFRVLPGVLEQLADDFEIIVVNDGSSDGTGEYLREYAQDDSRVRVVQFTRNFGQQAAMTAGLDCADGDVVVVMDCDLQDPPELLAQMLEKLREGYDVVSCQRASRAGESLFKRWSATAFYQLMKRGIDERIPPEVGDFRMYTRRAASALRGMREQHRFMRGIVAWLGMKEALITFDRPARVAGETKYPLSKLVRLAWTAISSSSAIPLKIMSYGGGLMLGGSLCILALGLVALAMGFSQATNALWIGFFAGLAGLQLCSIGLLGDYIGRIFEESKGRPLYVVGDVCNIDSLPQADRSIWLGQSISPHSLEVGAQTRGKSHREQRDPMIVPLPKRDAA